MERGDFGQRATRAKAVQVDVPSSGLHHEVPELEHDMEQVLQILTALERFSADEPHLLPKNLQIQLKTAKHLVHKYTGSPEITDEVTELSHTASISITSLKNLKKSKQKQPKHLKRIYCLPKGRRGNYQINEYADDCALSGTPIFRNDDSQCIVQQEPNAVLKSPPKQHVKEKRSKLLLGLQKVQRSVSLRMFRRTRPITNENASTTAGASAIGAESSFTLKPADERRFFDLSLSPSHQSLNRSMSLDGFEDVCDERVTKTVIMFPEHAVREHTADVEDNLMYLPIRDLESGSVTSELGQMAKAEDIELSPPLSTYYSAYGLTSSQSSHDGSDRISDSETTDFGAQLTRKKGDMHLCGHVSTPLETPTLPSCDDFVLNISVQESNYLDLKMSPATNDIHISAPTHSLESLAAATSVESIELDKSILSRL